jgi:hypothetical protein
MKFLIKVIILIFLIFNFLYAKEIIFCEKYNIGVNLPQTWILKHKKQKQQTYLYMFDNKENNCKICITISKTVVTEQILKEITLMEASRINSQKVNYIRNKEIYGYYYQGESFIWKKNKKIRKYLKRFVIKYNLYLENKYFVSYEITYNNSKNLLASGAKKILQTIHIQNSKIIR